VAAPRPRRWLEPAASHRSTSASGTACKRDPPPLRSLAEVAPVPRAIHAHARYSPSHSRTMSVPMILSASASNRSILRDVRACSSLLVISIEPSDVDVNVDVSMCRQCLSRMCERWMGGWVLWVGWLYARFDRDRWRRLYCRYLRSLFCSDEDHTTTTTR